MSQTYQDEQADKAIKAMVASVIGTSLIPAHVNWALTASAMGAGVVAIGRCYGTQLSKDEAWKLVRQFITAAGSWFVAMNIGSKFMAMVLQSTGIGYAPAVAIDAAVSSAIAYAIGEAAKDSTGETEGLPVVLLESLASGKPVVATRVAGAPDVIVDGHNGFLAKPQDGKDLAEKMVQALNADAAALSKNARGSVQKYDWEMIGKDYRDGILQLFD